jgi:Concanavalin A-like lectin/glucanases superfamily
VAVAVFSVVASLLLDVPSASAAVATPVSCVDEQPNARAASAMASRCGRVVEDLSARSPWSQTSVKPDGSRELVSSVRPRWARRADGSWAAVDTTLRRSGGAVVPEATVLPLSFSGGGAGPLARLADGDRELAVSWPDALPAPVLTSDAALYPEVLPGVDLRLTATPAGFTEVLVVKTPAAARHPKLARVRLGLTMNGLAVRPATGAGLEAVDSNGHVVFEAPAPTMWDSSGSDGPGAGRTAVMPVHVSAGEVVVIPDAAMLADPATKFPVFIDPSWTGHMAGMWKVVASHLPDSSTFALTNGDLNGNAGSGRTCDVSSGGVCQSSQYLVRTMFRMETFGVAGKHVLQATFNITQKWSWTCNPASDAKLWLTGAISSSTTWNTQPFWDSAHTATALASHRRDQAAGCSGSGNVAFDATGMVQLAVASGWPDLTVGLRAADEGTVNQWKRFDASSVSLAIVYNSPPNTPDTLTTDAQGCGTGSGRPVVGTTEPTLSARVTDPDGASEGDINGTLRGEFAWEYWNSATSAWTLMGTGSGIPQANGTTSPAPVPDFASGGVFRWHVRAADSWSLPNVGSGKDYSAWTGWCEFEVDATPPNPPNLTPDASNTPFVAGKTVRVSFSPGGNPADSDVTGYTWWVVDGAGTHQAATVAGSTVTVSWTPIAGDGHIYAQARDRASNRSNPTVYSFTAAQLPTVVARWKLDDPAGSATAVDMTGTGHEATAALTAPATFGAPGLIINGPTVLSLNGGAANSVATAGPVIDTSRNFTVAAWLRVSDMSSSRTAVSQDGLHSNGFQLQYAQPCACWRFALPDEDTVNPGLIGATSTVPPRLNVWTHLVGVYDSATGTVRLYVNGVLAGTATRQAAPWNATGPLRIGRSKWNDNPAAFFAGGMSDVRVWDRILTDTEIAAMVDPTDPSNVATATVGQWLIRPEDCPGNPVTFCLDDASMGHDLGLSGGVTITTAGQSGSALLFNGTDGVAQTTEGNPGPVLHTDQSFTVSTWVKLGNVPAHNYTALGQDGNYVSAFYLGYRIFGGTTPRWSFSMKDIDNDASGVTWTHAYAPTTLTAADVGKWVHLVGVYDAATGGMSLYVDGALAGTATRTATPWDATGPMTIGTAWYTQPGGTPGLVDHWNGTIDTVTVYAGAVPATSINRIP